MLNPDGVIHGHYRDNILGKDLNRMWQDPRPNVTPTIYYLKKLISINKPFFFVIFMGIQICQILLCIVALLLKRKKINFSAIEIQILNHIISMKKKFL
jgi:cytochrome c biogenesis factor